MDTDKTTSENAPEKREKFESQSETDLRATHHLVGEIEDLCASAKTLLGAQESLFAPVPKDYDNPVGPSEELNRRLSKLLVLFKGQDKKLSKLSQEFDQWTLSLRESACDHDDA